MNQHLSQNFPDDMSFPVRTVYRSAPRRSGAPSERPDDRADEFDFWHAVQPWGYSPFYPGGPMPHRGRRGRHAGPHPPSGGPPPPAPPPNPFPVYSSDPSHLVHLDLGSALDEPPAPPVERASSLPSRASTPPTPPEKAPEEPGRHRSVSRSPRRGHGEHPRERYERHHGHGRFRGRGGRRGGPDRHDHHGGPPLRGSSADPLWYPPGPPPGMPYNFRDFSSYMQQLPDQTFGFINNLLRPMPPIPDPAPFPDVDVFTTTDSFIIHAYVAGAKKANLDVSFDPTINTVKISGMIHRPDEVDEEMLERCVQRESKIGFFEKMVFLEKSVHLLHDGLTAKLEDGVLRIEIQKDEGETWTEVRKVVIE